MTAYYMQKLEILKILDNEHPLAANFLRMSSQNMYHKVGQYNILIIPSEHVFEDVGRSVGLTRKELSEYGDLRFISSMCFVYTNRTEHSNTLEPGQEKYTSLEGKRIKIEASNESPLGIAIRGPDDGPGEGLQVVKNFQITTNIDGVPEEVSQTIQIYEIDGLLATKNTPDSFKFVKVYEDNIPVLIFQRSKNNFYVATAMRGIIWEIKTYSKTIGDTVEIEIQTYSYGSLNVKRYKIMLALQKVAFRVAKEIRDSGTFPEKYKYKSK